MTKPYSEDLRIRIVQAVEDQGVSQPIVAERFAVSLSSVKRYLRQYRVTGTLRAAASPGRPRAIPPAAEAALITQFDAAPDATFATHCAQWEAATGRRVSQSTLCRAQQRLGWTRKKRV
ncbi:MAG: transposase [Thermomicrobia bacterium]|nr:transposase [Thermomicrobia bacterium]